MPVTIRDVAREAGVAISTVSRMLNDSGPVSPQTRARIARAAEALGYVPHAAARSLITSKTFALGVLLPDLHGEFYSEILRGIDQAARPHAYHILVSSSHNEATEIEAGLRMMHGRVDGLILMSPNVDAATLHGHLPADLPIILLNCAVEDMQYDSLNVDNAGGAEQMVRHLVDLGHRRIAFIGGGARNLDARERERGYRAALVALGVDVDEGLIWEVDFTQDSGHRATTRALAAGLRPTAVFGANDAMAVGAMHAVHEAGLDVPDDIAIAGFDDIPIARYLHPPLTSVHVPISRFGALAVERLVAVLDPENGHIPVQKVIPTRLHVRASTEAAPVAA